MTTETLPAKTGGTRQPSAFEQAMEEYTPQIVAALPAHIPIERFKRVVITAVNQNPDLQTADRRSLFISCVRAAQDGLMPDGREAALVIFGKVVQYMPMIAGVRIRMRNSGEVDSANAHVVYENDEFDYRLGDDPFISHKPKLDDRGKPIAAYAIIKLTNGEILREVMNLDEIEQVRAVSRAKNGPWNQWWGEMARKTVLRRCAKAAPMQSDLDEFLKRDDELGLREPIDITPDRPTRAAFVDSADTWTGVIHMANGSPTFDDEAEYLNFFGEGMRVAAEAGGREALETYWEANSAGLAAVEGRGHETAVQEVRDLYTQLDGDAAKAEAEAEPSGAEDGPSAGADGSTPKAAPVKESAPAAPAATKTLTVHGLPKTESPAGYAAWRDKQIASVAACGSASAIEDFLAGETWGNIPPSAADDAQKVIDACNARAEAINAG